jgi:biopolymer transport protein ExbB
MSFNTLNWQIDLRRSAICVGSVLFAILSVVASSAGMHAQQPGSTPQTNSPSGMMQPQGGNNFASPYGTQLRQSYNGSAPAGNYPPAPDARLAALNTTAANQASSSDAGSEPSNEANANGKIGNASLLKMFHDGGLMMYPIAICSFVLMVFSFERFIHLRTGRVIPRPFVKRLIEQLQQQQIDREEGLELCERNPSPIASILAAAVKRYGRPAVEIEQAVLDAGERESNNLRRHMRLLNAISNVSPLLGLLGTVLGMIQAFNDIAGAQAMGRPEMLAGGIGQALLTTAAGLLVAIPAYLMYMYFLGHTDRLIMEMDRHAQRLVDAISAEGLQENDTSRTRARTRRAA